MPNSCCPLNELDLRKWVDGWSDVSSRAREAVLRELSGQSPLTEKQWKARRAFFAPPPPAAAPLYGSMDEFIRGASRMGPLFERAGTGWAPDEKNSWGSVLWMSPHWIHVLHRFELFTWVAFVWAILLLPGWSLVSPWMPLFSAVRTFRQMGIPFAVARIMLVSAWRLLSLRVKLAVVCGICVFVGLSVFMTWQTVSGLLRAFAALKVIRSEAADIRAFIALWREALDRGWGGIAQRAAWGELDVAQAAADLADWEGIAALGGPAADACLVCRWRSWAPPPERLISGMAFLEGMLALRKQLVDMRAMAAEIGESIRISRPFHPLLPSMGTLDDVYLGPDGFTAVHGDNGSGKSTLLRAIGAACVLAARTGAATAQSAVVPLNMDVHTHMRPLDSLGSRSLFQEELYRLEAICQDIEAHPSRVHLWLADELFRSTNTEKAGHCLQSWCPRLSGYGNLSICIASHDPRVFKAFGDHRVMREIIAIGWRYQKIEEAASQ